MPNCVGIKADGNTCRCAAAPAPLDTNLPHLHFCRTHWKSYLRHADIAGNVHHVAGQCLHFLRTRVWCHHPAQPGTFVCATHANNTARRNNIHQRQAADEATINIVINQYQQVQPAMSWQAVGRHVYDRVDEFPNNIRRRIAVRYFNMHSGMPLRFFLDFWDWLDHGRHEQQPLEVVRPTALARIANDRQNVHTQAVSEQTNKSLEILLENAQNSTYASMRSPAWLAAKWLSTSYGRWTSVCPIVNDMHIWYNQHSCRTPNDNLYRRALDGLYLYVRNIPDEETKRELYKRVFEECNEAVSLCCDGHISRLCNVLVGFDDAFKPSVSIGELIQNEMAKISTIDVETDEKIRMATAFFTEHNVPETDRTVWLEAF